jgi:ABC-2 type transport system permease protein
VTELNTTAWTGAQTRAQFGAIARLRWQMYRNGFRRKGAKGDLIATAIVTPIALVILGGLCAGAASTAAFAVYSGHVERVSWVLWGIFFFSQLVNLNVGQPGTTFDPTQLIRFPMTTASYTSVRLFFGILSPGNIMVVMVSLAAAAGVTIVRPHLWIWAFLAMAVFAAVNVMFTRMVFSWVDRWLSTRRAREAFTALIFLVSMGAQCLNFLYNPAYHNKHVDLKTVRKVQATIAKTEPYLRVLPPELGGAAVMAGARGDGAGFVEANVASAAWGTLFLFVFALRMRTEYRGENLSDAANAVKTTKPVQHEVVRAAPVAIARQSVGQTAGQISAPGDVVRAVAAKELLYLRRNTGLFYGLIMPLIMVLVFAGRWASRSSSHGPSILMGALAYGLLGVFPMSFNSFGLDGTGTQTYFFTPVRLREVMMGKNVLCAGLALAETIAILGILSYSARRPSTLILVGALLWMITTLLVQMTVGNYMSIRSPRRIDPGRTAQKQARPASAFLSMGIMLVAGLAGAAVTFLSGMGHVEWVVPLLFVCTTAVATWIYWVNLNKLDAYGFLHRDDLFEELQKKA